MIKPVKRFFEKRRRTLQNASERDVKIMMALLAISLALKLLLITLYVLGYDAPLGGVYASIGIPQVAP